MKAEVTEIFQDKFTGEHHYVGDLIDIDDAERIADLKDRGLIRVAEEAEPKKTATKRSKK